MYWIDEKKSFGSFIVVLKSLVGLNSYATLFSSLTSVCNELSKNIWMDFNLSQDILQESQ